jgi:drug/metabolite transporter (DMT)-like permease
VRPIAVIALCSAALIGFAANSLLCRAALAGATIDAASFTAIRIGSGAMVLAFLVSFAKRPVFDDGRRSGSWLSGVALCAYAAAFSFAYLSLTAATGALILCGCVQVTMLGYGIARGERPRPLEWLGLAMAAAGLVALSLPGLEAPSPLPAGLMAIAGVSWGIYTLRGRGAKRPLAATADNFLRAVPFAGLTLLAIPIVGGHITTEGAVLATTSGAVASGIGYSLWYAVLPQLTATRAAILQLLVPVIAATGGVLLLEEPMTARLVGAAAAIIGGIALAMLGRKRA